ncbi:uncharacterized protein LOC121746850 [Salvia splendens]|uniref:uncharacterized protein LOC121746850 n=1 Tax=Salvia splendens TaxID=180675 RepID=UPI001C269FED|nr:uncharacterized protein LOC121746850 [Salvia splendens]XP_041996728.1 uncharacterized protein LOC121746850 [Salvia splendens]
MQEESIDHFVHEHTLTLIQSDNNDFCYGCGRYFFEEAAYGCTKCGNRKYLHTDCAERPTKITHSRHPQHTLVLKLADAPRKCAACHYNVWRIGYFCTSSGCEFQIHIQCELAAGVKHVADEQICIQHPSHHQHQLILMKKRHSFNCDACGTMETGRSYVCIACQYWIHEDCAALPPTIDYNHHHHPLSLAFYLPTQYTNFFYSCDICTKDLLVNRWVYHCQICRYIVHIKCATNPPTPTEFHDPNDQEVASFPVRDVHEDLIKPFVTRERGQMVVIPAPDDQKYSFPFHRHQLILVSSSISEIDDDDDDDDDDGEDGDGELACDACTMPIFPCKKHQSFSSSSSDSYRYMSCGECKYFLHLACFNLPPELPSHPLHKHPHHNLILEACPKLEFWTKCNICLFLSNGLRYACRECNFIVDVKCASLPKAIKHEAHPNHHLYLKYLPTRGDGRQGVCRGCVNTVWFGLLYKCSSCSFTLCSICIFLPQVNKHGWEKHPLPLTYEGRFNHPGDFYCDSCELEMHPRGWMYQCGHCDTSFHATCFPEASGYCRNIKFGQQYNVRGDVHPHPLTFKLVTTKLRCDVCRFTDIGPDPAGLYCSSCNFFMCMDRCTSWRLPQILPVE